MLKQQLESRRRKVQERMELDRMERMVRQMFYFFCEILFLYFT